MGKILIEVYVPSVYETFEIYIPIASRMSEILMLIGKAVRELTGGAYHPGREELICERESGAVYNINLTAEEIGLKNGARLMVV